MSAAQCPHDGFATVDAALHDAAPDPRIGSTYQGRYRIDAHLGAGGMGAVYRATQLAVERPVALKILHPALASDLNEVARFQQEARAIASLAHPNAVALIDYGQADDGSLFLVMECLEGESLGARMKSRGPFTPNQVIRVAVQILDVLDAAHTKGIVHRDLKPENLFLIRVGRRPDFVKVLDFGIAKLVSECTDQARLTATGIAIGSPKYMSPEQARASTVDPRSDLYSLGVVMYEMLTGSLPFRAGSARGYLMAHIQGGALPPKRDGTELGGPLVDSIMQCLERDPDARPPSAVSLQRSLEEALSTGHPVVAFSGGGSDSGVSPQMADAPGSRAPSSSTRPLTADRSTQTRPAPSAPSAPTRPLPSSSVRPGLKRAFGWLVVAALLLIGIEWLTTLEMDRVSTRPGGPLPADSGGPSAPVAVSLPDVVDVPDTAAIGEFATMEVRIQTVPSQATVQVEGESDPRAPGEVRVRWSERLVPPRVEIRCPGYQAVTHDLQVSEAGGTVEVVLVPISDVTPPKSPSPTRTPKRPRYDRL